jgi:hypothetical protein
MSAQELLREITEYCRHTVFAGSTFDSGGKLISRPRKGGDTSGSHRSQNTAATSKVFGPNRNRGQQHER